MDGHVIERHQVQILDAAKDQNERKVKEAIFNQARPPLPRPQDEQRRGKGPVSTVAQWHKMIERTVHQPCLPPTSPPVPEDQRLPTGRVGHHTLRQDRHHPSDHTP